MIDVIAIVVLGLVAAAVLSAFVFLGLVIASEA